MRMYFAVWYLKYGISASFSDGKSDSMGMARESCCKKQSATRAP